MLAIVTRVFSTFVQTLSDPCDSNPSHTATTFNMVKQESPSLSSLRRGVGASSIVSDGTSSSRNSCGICYTEVNLKTSAALQEHLEKAHFYCGSCRWFAESAELLVQHNESIHRMCVDCAKVVSNGRGICEVSLFQFDPVSIEISSRGVIISFTDTPLSASHQIQPAYNQMLLLRRYLYLRFVHVLPSRK